MYKYFLGFVLASAPSFALSWSYNHDVISKNGMVVTANSIATNIGLDTLKKGGNAIDAAVAVGYALSVVHPCCGNLGGGGFMTIHLNKNKLTRSRNIFINFREKAPGKAYTNMFLDDKGNIIKDKSTSSFYSIGVPGTVLGLNTALKKYGTMSLQEVMNPAIQLAEKGIILSEYEASYLSSKRFINSIRKNNPAYVSQFTHNGTPYKSGDHFIQKNLANSLSLISKNGSKAFYEGPIAKEIVNVSRENNGLISLQDLKNYNVEIMNPIECNYRGYKVFSAPPPSSGGVSVCEALTVLKQFNLRDQGFHSAQNIHKVVETLRHVFAQRNMNLGDPDFIKNPISQMISNENIKKIISSIKPNKATPSSEVNGALIHEGKNTTHYSIVDKQGNAVSVTYTLNSFFGSKYIAGNAGFFLNNEMDDFTSKVGSPNQFGLIQGKNNSIEPGKRPLSAMTPTIVLDNNNQVVLVTGSPGGSTIISAVLQVILNTIDYRMNLYSSVNSPRYHHQWYPDIIKYETGAFTPHTIKQLKKMGYKLVEREGSSGAAESIGRFSNRKIWDAVTHDGEKIYYWEGVNDNRRVGGSAAGY